MCIDVHSRSLSLYVVYNLYYIMYTVYCIVEKTEGFDFVDTAVGVGTKFSIYLPTHYGAN